MTGGGDDDRKQAEAAFGAHDAGRRRPSVAGYWIGGAIIAAGVLGAIAWFVAGMIAFSNAVDDLARVSIPGTRVVTLSAGRKAIYYEGPGGENASWPPLRIAIDPAPAGPELRVGPHSGTVKYSIGGHAGRSLAGFTVPRAGRYRVSVTAPTGAPESAELAIGRGLGGRIVRTVVGALVLFFGGALAGTAVIVWTSVQRSRRSQRPRQDSNLRPADQ